MKLVYLAAPLSPVHGETREQNIYRTKVIYEDLVKKHEDCVFLVPWLLAAEVLSEIGESRALGLRKNLAVIEKCDELWLIGPRVSPGMRVEADWAAKNGITVRTYVDGSKSDGGRTGSF